MFKSKFNKGFSLVEMLVAIAIIGVLSAILIPALSGAVEESKEKSDISAVRALAPTLQISVQNNAIYNTAESIARKTTNDCITMVYYLDDENNLTFDYSYINTGASTIKSSDDDEVAIKMRRLNDDIMASVNGQIEPIKIRSKFYKNKSYEIVLHFPDMNFKVDADLNVNEKYR